MTEFLPPRIVTGEQIRAARAMLRLDQKQFAGLTHVTVGTVRRLEATRGPVTAASGLLEAMCSALEDAGIELIEAGPYDGIGGPGIRMRGEPVATDDVIDFEAEAAKAEVPGRIVPEAS